MFDRYATFFVRHRGGFAVAVVLVTLVAAAGCSLLEFDDDPRSIFRARDAEFAVLERLGETFGNDDGNCFVLLEADDVFAPEVVARMRSATQQLAAVDGVARIQGLDDIVVFEAGAVPRPLLPAPGAPPDDYLRAKRDALAHPLTAGQLVTNDGGAALLVVSLSDETVMLDRMREVVEAVRHISADISVDGVVRAAVTGVPTLRVDIIDAIRWDQQVFAVVGCGLGLMMLVLLFRRVTEIVIVSIAAGVGSVWALGALGLAGGRVNVLNSILPMLVLVIGFADAVHVMFDIQRSRAEGLSTVDASARAIRHLGAACLMTSLTTAVGFGSLAVARIDIIRGMGLACAAGVGLALAAVLTVVPLAASGRLGRRITTDRVSAVALRHEGWFAAFIAPVIRGAPWVAAVGIVATVGLAAVGFQLRPDNRWDESIPTGSETFRAWQRVDQDFGGSQFAYVLVRWPDGLSETSDDLANVIAELESILEADPMVHHPLSILSVLRSVPGGLDGPRTREAVLQTAPQDLVRRFIRPDLRSALVSAHVSDLGSAAYEPVFDRINARLDDLMRHHPGFDLHLTGTVVVAGRNLNYMIVDLAWSLAGAAVVIFGTMTLAFRSVRLGIISVVPNVFPLALTAGVLVWAGNGLQITSVIVFSICLGIAVDDTIHFIVRFQRELRLDGECRAAVARSMTAIGAALVTTSAVLLAGFGGMLLSNIPAMRLFAWLCCLAVGSALIGDLVLLPALLVCFAARPNHPEPPSPDTGP